MHAVRWVGKSLTTGGFCPSDSVLCRWLFVRPLCGVCQRVRVGFLVRSRKKKEKKKSTPNISTPGTCVSCNEDGRWMTLQQHVCASGRAASRWRCENENVCFKLYEVQRGSQMWSIKQLRRDGNRKSKACQTLMFYQELSITFYFIFLKPSML